MDSLCTAAAHALTAGDPLGALARVALRSDADALALRGIAMAQLGELTRAKQLLSRAARAFGPGEAVARARCHVAEAEVALAARSPVSPRSDRTLMQALAVLDTHGDLTNALHARLLLIRRWLLLGRIDRAEAALEHIESPRAPAMFVAILELTRADVALRRMRITDAKTALSHAREAAVCARIAALLAEVDSAVAAMQAPVARHVRPGHDELLCLEQVEAWYKSGALIIDACRRVVRCREERVSLAKRPVLFSLLRELAQVWPQDATRDALIANAFGARRANASHRARLRVELGRVRRELRHVLQVTATPRGYRLAPYHAHAVVVLAPPIDSEAAALLALLADGQSWSTSALALALGQSQRTVQRTLSELEARGRVHSVGRARAQRWLTPSVSGFATTLLLPAPASIAP